MESEVKIERKENAFRRFKKAFMETYDTPLGPDKNRAWQAFWITLVMAVILFIPLVAWSKGIFCYYGDYNAQQIPFYKMAHDMVRAGTMGWNWNTDLGVNFVGSYTFYLLGSPFFWLTIPFPSACVPYLMAPLYCLKMACMSLTCYLFLHRFVRSEYAVIGGILYAFCGFACFNVFFNHFHEAMVWLPLMLYGLELRMSENKRGVFALAVFMSAMNNYYFFIGQILFLLIYWFVRLWSGAWKLDGKKIAGLWIEAILGTALAGVLLLPSYYSVIQNSRTENYLTGWRLLIFSKEQRLWDIIHCFFFPPDLPARPNFFEEADNKWASMSAWIPMFGCTGAIGYFQSRKHKDWLHRLLIIVVVMAIIPAFNALFQLLNSQYYARWFYMLTLVLILATVKSLDAKPGDPKVNWNRAFGWSTGITLFFVVFVGLAPSSWTSSDPKIGLERYPDRFWIYVGIVLVGLILAAVGISIHKNHKKLGIGFLGVFCAFISLAYSWYYIGIGQKISTYNSDFTVTRSINGINEVKLPETEDWYRIDVNECQDNIGMYWQYPCIQAFHSIVPESVTKFYKSIGVSRSVASRPDTSHYGLRSLTSVLWEFDYANTEGPTYSKASNKYFESKDDGSTKMLGYTKYGMTNGFYIYKNTNFIPMGFTYDSYATKSQYDSVGESNRELMMLKTIVVEDDQEQIASEILPKFNMSSAVYGYDAFEKDCAARRQTTCSNFQVTKSGFEAKITLNKPNLVFFSVPYELDGWTATVNGKQAEIVISNVGFMSVVCPQGESEIVFTYKTPGLVSGACFTGASAVLLGLYLWFAPKIPDPKELRRKLRKKRKESAKPESDEKEKMETTSADETVKA